MDEVRVRAPVFEGVLRKRSVDFRPAIFRVRIATIAMQSQRPDSQCPEVISFHDFRCSLSHAAALSPAYDVGRPR